MCQEGTWPPRLEWGHPAWDLIQSPNTGLYSNNRGRTNNQHQHDTDTPKRSNVSRWKTPKWAISNRFAALATTDDDEESAELATNDEEPYTDSKDPLIDTAIDEANHNAITTNQNNRSPPQ
jgi:hypothetical protein